MDSVATSRITVQTESEWLRVKENVNKGIMGVMEARMSLLPGGRDGEAARGLRREVEARLAKVGTRHELC